jgi:hypothetical protein
MIPTVLFKYKVLGFHSSFPNFIFSPIFNFHQNKYANYSLGFSTTSGFNSLVAGECTSCEVSEDKSAYWTPALYFLNSETGEYTLVEQVGGMLA